MYYIYSRRTDIAVVQYYTPQHIKDITGTEASIETIKENWYFIQEFLTCDYVCDHIHEHLEEMSSVAEDWGLEELFPTDEEE